MHWVPLVWMSLFLVVMLPVCYGLDFLASTFLDSARSQSVIEDELQLLDKGRKEVSVKRDTYEKIPYK